MKMQLGMPTLIENQTLLQNIALCKSLGLSFIELNMNFPEYQLPALEDADTLLRAAEQAGLYYTIHLDENLNVADFNPLVRDAYLETVQRTIAAAKRLLPLRDRFGDTAQPLVVNMHMHHGISITLPDRKVQMYDRDRNVYLNAFARFGTLCEEWIGDADVVLCIENTDGFRDYEQQAIMHLLKSPCFGLTWDIGHSMAAGEGDVPFLMAHADRLRHFHIHDGTAKKAEKAGSNHLALGDGEIDIAKRMQLAQDKSARCVLETKTVEALKRSVAYVEAHGWRG